MTKDSGNAGLTVFYDGNCPLCAREIAFYQRRRGADKIAWQDVSSTPGEDVAPGLSRQQAMARFHVQEGDGDVISGGAAFARLWQALPAFRPFGLVFSVPPFSWLLDAAYPLFLKLRPRLQRLAAKKQ
ncbi:MAG: DUF393 domain-containing protein [Alphaproteobacteria bacterium]|nr:DUF393 domain-containing protein [Alphaproteobacteria bacterium]